MNETNLLRAKMKKLFRVLNDADYYRLQELLTEIENILNRCMVNNEKKMIGK